MQWPMWAGDIPAWITTLAVVGTVYQLTAERRWRRREEESARSSQARRLVAWVVNTGPELKKHHGVVVANTSHSVFHDVHIDVDLFDGAVIPSVTFVTLPPGRFYVQWEQPPRDQRRGWALPVSVDTVDLTLTPLTKAKGYLVTAMRFSDSLDQRWHTDRNLSLTRHSSAPTPAPEP